MTKQAKPIDRKRYPRKVSIPQEVWSDDQRAEWRRTVPEDEFDVESNEQNQLLQGKGPKNVLYAFERFWFVIQQELPHLLARPFIEWFTREALQAFILALLLPDPYSGRSTAVKYSTVMSYVGRIRMAAKRFGSRQNFKWLERFIVTLNFPKSGRREPPPLTTSEWWQIGQETMAQAREELEACGIGSKKSHLRHAIVLYRNGLLAATLALTVLRAGNIVGLKKGGSFLMKTTNAGYYVKITEYAAKNKKVSIAFYIPTQLEADYDFYFAEIRSRFPDADNSNYVFLSYLGGQLEYIGFYQAIVNLIFRKKGIHGKPHDARHAGKDAALEVGLDPTLLLDHANDGSTEGYGQRTKVDCAKITKGLGL